MSQSPEVSQREPLLTSSGVLLTFSPQPGLPFFYCRGHGSFQNPVTPTPCDSGMTEPVPLLSASCSCIQSPWGDCLCPVSLSEMQQRVHVRAHAQNSLCLLCHWHFLLGRAALQIAERKRMKKANNFYPFYRPLKNGWKAKAANGKRL